MPDHPPSGMTEIGTGTFGPGSGGVGGSPIESAEYLVFEVVTAPTGAGLQEGGEADRWFGWGWLVVGLIDFGHLPPYFLGSGSCFPVLMDLQGVHKDTFDYLVYPGWTLRWRALA